MMMMMINLIMIDFDDFREYIACHEYIDKIVSSTNSIEFSVSSTKKRTLFCRLSSKRVDD